MYYYSSYYSVLIVHPLYFNEIHDHLEIIHNNKIMHGEKMIKFLHNHV